MAKREQVVEEQVGLVAQAREAYEKLMNEIHEYSQKARECRSQPIPIYLPRQQKNSIHNVGDLPNE